MRMSVAIPLFENDRPRTKMRMPAIERLIARWFAWDIANRTAGRVRAVIAGESFFACGADS